MTTAEAPNAVELVIGGMTCASCAARIEKKLNKLDGVTASVNHATEKAAVQFADSVQPSDLIAAVEATGYSARGGIGCRAGRNRGRNRRGVACRQGRRRQAPAITRTGCGHGR
jgi:copper chaperone CopZ